jgi:hypothetical protein
MKPHSKLTLTPPPQRFDQVQDITEAVFKEWQLKQANNLLEASLSGQSTANVTDNYARKLNDTVNVIFSESSNPSSVNLRDSETQEILKDIISYLTPIRTGLIDKEMQKKFSAFLINKLTSTDNTEREGTWQALENTPPGEQYNFRDYALMTCIHKHCNKDAVDLTPEQETEISKALKCLSGAGIAKWPATVFNAYDIASLDLKKTISEKVSETNRDNNNLDNISIEAYRRYFPRSPEDFNPRSQAHFVNYFNDPNNRDRQAAAQYVIEMFPAGTKLPIAKLAYRALGSGQVEFAKLCIDRYAIDSILTNDERQTSHLYPKKYPGFSIGTAINTLNQIIASKHEVPTLERGTTAQTLARVALRLWAEDSEVALKDKSKQQVVFDNDTFISITSSAFTDKPFKPNEVMFFNFAPDVYNPLKFTSAHTHAVVILETLGRLDPAAFKQVSDIYIFKPAVNHADAVVRISVHCARMHINCQEPGLVKELTAALTNEMRKHTLELTGNPANRDSAEFSLVMAATEYGLSGNLGPQAFATICKLTAEAGFFKATKPPTGKQRVLADNIAKAIINSSEIVSDLTALTQLQEALNRAGNKDLLYALIKTVHSDHINRDIAINSPGEVKARIKAQLELTMYDPEAVKKRNLLLVLKGITPDLLNTESRDLLRKIKALKPEVGSEVDQILANTPATARLADWWRGRK